MAGGGVDIKLSPRAHWRVQGDAIGLGFRIQYESI